LIPTNWMEIEFDSVPVNVSFARVAVGAFAAQLDFTLNDLEELKVAVSEAVTNAIVHGYENRPGHTVRIRVQLQKERLVITVEDDGVGIEDIDQALEPAYSTDPERMGLGFAFMKSFSDDLKIESAKNNGTKITMTKTRTRQLSSATGN